MESTPDLLPLLAWAFAKDILARPNGKAGYSNHDDGSGIVTYLVIDLPPLAGPAQLCLPVALEFSLQHYLPLYFGALTATSPGMTAHNLRFYGNYVGHMRGFFGAGNAPA